MRARSAARSAACAAALLAACAPAAAQEEAEDDGARAVWTGGGGSKSWNDGGNWASGRPPAPTIGLHAVFDDPAGASFGFGGREPFRFGAIELTERSGAVSVKAPGIVLGGSVNSEPDVGFIVEDAAEDGLVRNASSHPLALRGGVAAGWDLAVDATNGPVRFEGGFDPAGHALAKRGAFPLEISGGEPVALPSFDFAEGGLALSGGADVAIPNHELGARRGAGLRDAPRILVEGASTLRITNRPNESVWIRYPLVLGAPGGRTDRSTFVGNGNRLLLNRAPSFAPGACITNAGPISFAFHPTSAIPRTVKVPPGVRIHAQGLWLGGTPNLERELDARGHDGIRLLVEGPDIPDTPGRKKLSAPPVLLDLGPRGLLVGGSFDNAESSNALARLTGAVVLRTTGPIRVPEPPRRADGNRLLLEGGARADCTSLEVGPASCSNLLSLAGEGTALSVGGEGIWLGFGTDRPGVCIGDRIAVRDRARLHSEGPLRIGRGRRVADTAESLSQDCSATVSGGARLATAGAEIGCATHAGPVLSPSVLVDGAGSRWDLGGRALTIGAGRGAPLSNAIVTVRGGALLTNATDLVVGLADGSTPRECAFRLVGARAFTRGAVHIGRTTGGDREFESSGARAVVAGANGAGALWDFGGGPLWIGLSEGWRHTVRDCALELRPGGRLQNVGILSIGGGTQEAVFSEGNALELRGGSLAPVKEFRMGQGGILALAVNPATKNGTTPVEVEGDVKIGKGALVRPVAPKGVKARLYPVLLWKGKATGLENLALAPGVDPNRWKLHIDTEKKQVLLQRL